MEACGLVAELVLDTYRPYDVGIFRFGWLQDTASSVFTQMGHLWYRKRVDLLCKVPSLKTFRCTVPFAWTGDLNAYNSIAIHNFKKKTKIK